MNKKNLEKATALVLDEFCPNWRETGLLLTPHRVSEAYEFLLSGYSKEEELEKILTTFEPEGYDQLVLCKNIEFYSLCEHHLLPFYGVAHVGYIPDAKIIGASKLSRIVEIYARRLQLQERLTKQIARALNDSLEPKGVAVVIEAEHLCMKMRGVEKKQSSFVTSEMLGVFRDEPETRAEFFSLCRNGR